VFWGDIISPFFKITKVACINSFFVLQHPPHSNIVSSFFLSERSRPPPGTSTNPSKLMSSAARSAGGAGGQHRRAQNRGTDYTSPFANDPIRSIPRVN
jgi:hypothetical protein